MPWKSGVFLVAALAMTAAAPTWAQDMQPGNGGGCWAGHVIDGSTAEDARRAMTAAGYQQIHDLRKGCDNFWHGQAMKNGTPVRIVMSPDGEVMLEGD
jgi:hypothetical protein